MASILTSETVVGAIMGSGLTLLIGWYLQHKKEIRNLRQTIVGQLCSRTYEMIAELMELYSARVQSRNKDKERKHLANLTRLEGAAMEFEILIWRVFKRRRVRAAYHKLLNRMEKTKELITQRDIPSEESVNLAISWIEAQGSKATQFASQVAGINMRDRARLSWLGLNPWKWDDEVQNLSFKDEAPPWIFDLQIDFSKRQLIPDELQIVREKIRRKVGDMRCEKHTRAAHICLRGRGPEDFTFQIEACCAEFSEAVHRRLAREKASISNN